MTEFSLRQIQMRVNSGHVTCQQVLEPGLPPGVHPLRLMMLVVLRGPEAEPGEQVDPEYFGPGDPSRPLYPA